MKPGVALLAGIVLGGVATFFLMVVLGERSAERAASHRAATRPEAAAPELPEARLLQADEARGPASLEAPADETAAAAGAASADDRVGLLVYGLLTESDGAPVMSEYRGIRFVSEAGEQRDARVGDDGSYAITGLKPGTWSVTTGLVGYRPTQASLVLTAAQPVTRFDIVVERALRLVVSAFTPDGRPLLETLREQAGDKGRYSGLRLSALATVEPLGALRPLFARGWDRFGVGHYIDRFESWGEMEQLTAALPPGALGLLDLSVPLPVHVTLVMRNAVLATQRVEPGASEVVFRVALEAVEAGYASLTARFVDGVTRAPLEGVSLDVSDVQTSGGAQGESDANGVLHCANLLPGGLRFEAERDGYERLLATLTLEAGSHTDLGDVPLSPATTISGVVLDEDGRPTVARISLAAVDRAPSLTFDYSSWSWRSEADGSFRIENVGRRRYELRVADEGRPSKPVYVDTQAGDVSDVVLRIEAGQPVSVRMDWPASRQLGMRLRSVEGVRYTDWDGWNGQYVWTRRLPRGEYVAESYEGETVLQTVSFEVSDAPVALTLSGN